MALKALDIFKVLPKTNCKDCGCPTCLAFAMKLATKKASLDECPTASPEAKLTLEGASAPPVRLITIGAGDNKVQIGNETVLYRHDESFYHEPGVAVRIADTLDEAALTKTAENISKLVFDRVGLHLRTDMVAIDNVSGDAEKFKKAVQVASKLNLPMVFTGGQVHTYAAALEIVNGQPVLLHGADSNNWEAMAGLAKEKKCPLAVKAGNLDDLAKLTVQIKGAGVEDMVLDLTADSVSGTIQNLTAARRMALKKNLRSLGFPFLTFTTGTDEYDMVSQAISYVCKYAGVVVTDLNKPEQLLPLLALRQNIFTDPRKPIQVEPKIYEVGAVGETSPILITTNFSLTYYTVEGEVEASRVPAYIAVMDTEGTSVLTAFAADKLTSESVAGLLKSDVVSKLVSHRKVILPGYIAVMSGALAEESGWQVVVGPREASGIPKFLKTMWKA